MKRALFVAVLLVALPYLRSRIYRFPAPAVFAGSQFFNPYGELNGRWLRANFHVHGRAWAGMTNGDQSNEHIVQAYKDAGYDVAAMSNYHQIATVPGAGAFPAYEHGYNVQKRHQLALGAKTVEWFDFPLLQTTSHEQFTIDLLKQSADLVALAHPEGRYAYTHKDLSKLTGYDLIEVVNGQFIYSQAWDAALSAGRVVWGIGNDDGHDLRNSLRFAMGWTMVNARSAEPADVVEALRAGRTYTVLRLVTQPEAELTEVSGIDFKDGTLTITCTGAPSNFQFIGQDGAERVTVPNTLQASYRFTDQDTYIRAVIWSPRRRILLNPILRYDGNRLPAPQATVNEGATWGLRGGIALSIVAVVMMRRRKPKAES